MLRNWKKWLMLLALALPVALLSGCGDDDDDDDDNDDDMGPVVLVSSLDIRFISVDPAGDQFTLSNMGTDIVRVSGFILCSQLIYTVGTNSATIDQLEIVLGDLELSPGENLTLRGFPLNDNAADFAIYLPGTTDFASDERMVDFLQWGDSFGTNEGREGEAVSAGIWESGAFIEGEGPYTFNGTNLTSRGPDFWEAATPPAAGRIRIVGVDPANDEVTIKNFSETETDISNYQLCSLLSYGTLSSLTITTGDLSLAADEMVTVSGWSLNDGASDVGLYSGSNFSSPNDMVDFMQYGSANNGREEVAVTKGIWGNDAFVSGTGPFEYTGDGAQDGANFWQ